MILVDDETYYETLEVLRGNKQLPIIFSELKNWLLDEYQVEAHNFEFKKTKFNKIGKGYRLLILLSSWNDFLLMWSDHGYDTEKQTAIADKLYYLAQKYDMENINKYGDVFVAFVDFSHEMKTDYINQMYKLVGKQMAEKFAIYSVWDIHLKTTSVVVFYCREVNVKTNQFIGISKQIKDEFYETLHHLDEFNVFNYESFTVVFDNKENLDTNYEGNMFYYDRS